MPPMGRLRPAFCIKFPIYRANWPNVEGVSNVNDSMNPAATKFGIFLKSFIKFPNTSHFLVGYPFHRDRINGMG